MENLYANFDGLDLSFHGRVSEDVLRLLDEAKARAVEERGAALAEIGGIPMMVKETGRRGGYAFVCDTGEDGEIWALKGKNHDNGTWVLHCSVKSAAFVQFGGLDAIRDRLKEKLKAFGYEPIKCPKSGLLESVGRVDFAIDFRADDFELDPRAFAAKAGSTDYCELGTNHWRGRRCTGVTIGKMPNRQVIVYDKTSDIAAKRKAYWWDVWGLDPDEGARVWRVELRAGKRLLSEAWKLRTLDDLEASIGDLMANTLRMVRYVERTDSNVTRCPDAELWVQTAEVLAQAIYEHVSGLAPDKVRQTCRDQFDLTMKSLLKGIGLTYAAVMVGTGNLTAIRSQLEGAAFEILDRLEKEPDEVLKDAAKARERYRLMESEQWHKQRKNRSRAWMIE